jgi:hypothetical protein
MKKQDPKKQAQSLPCNFNTLTVIENKTYLDIENIECMYVNDTYFNVQVFVDDKEFWLSFEAKELLEVLNKRTINELKENLIAIIDSL